MGANQTRTTRCVSQEHIFVLYRTVNVLVPAIELDQCLNQAKQKKEQSQHEGLKTTNQQIWWKKNRPKTMQCALTFQQTKHHDTFTHSFLH